MARAKAYPKNPLVGSAKSMKETGLTKSPEQRYRIKWR